MKLVWGRAKVVGPDDDVPEKETEPAGQPEPAKTMPAICISSPEGPGAGSSVGSAAARPTKNGRM